MTGRKRSRDEFSEDNGMGVASTLARLNGANSGLEQNGEKEKHHVNGNEAGGEWQQVTHKKRRKAAKQDGNNYPTITHSPNARLQTFVKIGDLQNLALYLLADGNTPQWCAVRHHNQIRKVVILMVPGLEAGMFDGSIPLTELPEEPAPEIIEGSAADSSKVAKKDINASEAAANIPSQPTNPRKLALSPDDYYPTKLVPSRLPEVLQPLGDIFDHIWPIKTPGEDKWARMHSPLAAMLTTSILRPKEEKKGRGPQPPPEGKNWRNQRTAVTEMLATKAELAEEGYVLHPALYKDTSTLAAESLRREVNKTTTSDGWMDTPGIKSLSDGDVPDKDIEKGSVTAGRKVLAMDCEMCITSAPGVKPQVFSLTRVSLIDWDGNTILDEFVKPADPITDYLTPYSGITPAMLENVTTTLSDIQAKLTSIFTPQTILVGHSLNSDMNALQLTHPFIIDTTLLFPHPRGPPLKSSLKWLSQKYLSREIQKGHGSTGHDSVEDAKACLDLVKQKCEKGKAWGTSEASAESLFKRLGYSYRRKRDKVNAMGDDEPRTGAVVDWGDPSKGYGGQAKAAIGCESDIEIVAGIKRALTGGNDDSVVPKGGCDFVWARLRELEAYRGWWRKSKQIDADALRSSTTDDTIEESLALVTAKMVQHVREIFEALPPCTAFIVYSGSGDPRDLSDMSAMQQKFKEEYKTKKWDELSVRWTDVEEQKLRKACEKARKGIGFVAVK